MAALRSPRRLLGSAVDLYWGSGVVDDVPALAWFMLSALVPLALGLTALASLVLGDYAEAQALAQRAARVLPDGVSDQVVQLILRTPSESPLLLAGSIALMVWTSAGAVGVLERSMSRQLDRRRFGPMVGKARHLGLAAGVAAVVVLMVLAASRRGGVALWPAALAATAALCASLYHLCPRSGIPWHAAALGAA